MNLMLDLSLETTDTSECWQPPTAIITPSIFRYRQFDYRYKQKSTKTSSPRTTFHLFGRLHRSCHRWRSACWNHRRGVREQRGCYGVGSWRWPYPNSIWGVPQMGVPPIAGWFIMEYPINMDDEQGYPYSRKPQYGQYILVIYIYINISYLLGQN